MPGRHPPLTIDRRYCGPPTSANGGYFAGRLAAYVADGRAVAVTLRQPPPLDAPLLVGDSAGGPGLGSADGVVATFGGAPIADAVPVDDAIDALDPVSYEQAAKASLDYRGDIAHPFPTCFVCGTGRSAPDGLALRPGPLPGEPASTAAPWVPHQVLTGIDGRLPAELVWAALDCPGGWTIDLAGRPSVLGRITAVVDALPEPGDECVVAGRLIVREGRKAHALTTLYDGDGRVLARAASVWIEVDPTRITA